MVTAATIGSKLESVRKGLNLTLSEVSEKTKLAQSALSEFENGKRSRRSHNSSSWQTFIDET